MATKTILIGKDRTYHVEIQSQHSRGKSRPSDPTHSLYRRYRELCVLLDEHHDGTDGLGIIVSTALADDPRATVQDIAAILKETEEDARAERLLDDR